MTDPDDRFARFEDRESLDGDGLDGETFEPIAPPAWRRPLLIVVAVLTAIALAVVPLYDVFQGVTVADNGLEVCGFDYCVVQEAVREAGLDTTMSRLSSTFNDEVGSRAFALALTDHLGVSPVDLEVVDRLEGRIGGVYDPATRSIRVERPARAWTVLHEVAHVIETGHGEAFRRVVIELTDWVDESSG